MMQAATSPSQMILNGKVWTAIFLSLSPPFRRGSLTAQFAPLLTVSAFVRLSTPPLPQYHPPTCCDFPHFLPAHARKTESRWRPLTSDPSCTTAGIACEGGICQPPPNPMTVSCELSLRRGICGYHFPVCVSDQVTISHEASPPAAPLAQSSHSTFPPSFPLIFT